MLRYRPPIIGLAHGCFDIFHFGHLNHLAAARVQCDRLYVCITPDEYVNKGPNRPIFPAANRCLVINGLKCVHHAFVGLGPDVAINALSLVKPNIYFKGQEYKGDHPALAAERAFCEANGIEVRFTEEPVFSTTLALQRLKEATS